MSIFGCTTNETDYLNENNLPVELQTPNVINPVYSVSAVQSSNGLVKTGTGVGYNGTRPGEPYVEISEQPQQRGFRFRYECEGPSHGGLQGTKSERSRKSYPTIKICNYSGAARVVVSLVTDEKTPRAHAHKLVGSNCKNGLCTVEVKANVEPVSFANLSILHVTRKKLVDVLTERILDSIILNKKLKANNMNFDPPLTDEDKRTARQQAEEQSKTMQLNVVRLCFQVFLRNVDGSFSTMLTPVVSQPIYDSKSPGASALKICRMDKYGGCCSGNEEVFLLCEKVQKDDIQVRFVEQNSDGSVKWEAYGNFGPLDVHRQYAIVFKTPAYWNTNIDKAVNVLIMLQRKTDLEVSEPKAFTYFPQNRDKDNIASKKRKRIPLDGYDFGGDGSLSGPGVGGDGGGGYGLAGGNSPGSGSLGNSGGSGTNGNIMMVLQNSAEKEELGTSCALLESEHLMASINSASLSNDPWMLDEQDIEVDAAIIPTRPAMSTIRELPSVNTRKPPARPKGELLNEQTQHSQALTADKEHQEKKDKKPDTKCLPSESSLEWLDSGVDPDSVKSICSLDERKGSITIKDAGQQVKMDVKSGAKEGKLERKASRSSDMSENPSESDGKVEISSSSEGIRSDEGFSETSEETAIKAQQLSPLKSKCEGHVVKPKLDHSVSHCSQLTDTVRKVTGRVAERTLAALTDFAETGDIRHLLLVQRHLMAISNKNGDLPLHLAVINSQPKALKALLDVMRTLPVSEQLINSVNYLTQTPLHLATVMKQNNMVEMLLHAGADSTIADRNGNTAAHLAVLNNSSACLKTLVKYLRPGQSRTNPFPELNYLNYDGYSPVHLAALTGNVEMLRTLVFGQADVELPDGKSGKTALHHAVDNDDLPVAGYLLMEAGADVNARCFDGNTALHIACARQLVGMVALLMTAGADLDCENEEIPDPDVGDESGKMCRRGLKPVDYVNDNEQ
ncbi:unnamed protein product, partial [Candidula unifasciata]